MKTIKKIFATLLVLSVALSPLNAFAANNSNKITIKTADELIQFAEKCSHDKFSEALTVVLENDIDLSKYDYIPAAGFKGTFIGNGHIISGLKISGSYSPSGLFATLDRGGIVKDLNVIGNVDPSGSAENVGLIAGINKGSIINCTANGTIDGSSKTGSIAGYNADSGVIKNCKALGFVYSINNAGGICGYNDGIISDCINQASVNTNSFDPTVSLSDLNTDIISIIAGISAGNFNISSDCGGIAGYSSGQIIDCINNAPVGYPHVGYNRGGIAGRSCGFITNCINSGEVFARRDAGGIAGIAEPHIFSKSSDNPVKDLRTELWDIRSAIDDTTRHAREDGNTISNTFDSINDNIDNAIKKANKLTDILKGFTDNNIDEINRGMEIADESIFRLKQISSLLPGISSQINSGTKDLEKAFKKIEGIDYEISNLDDIDKIVDTLKDASTDLKSAAEHFSKASEDAKVCMDYLDDFLGFLNDEDRLIFSKLGKETEDAYDDLFGSLTDINDYLKKLDDNALFTTDQITEDLEIINSRVSRAFDIALDALESIQNTSISTYIRDTTEKGLANLTVGRIDECTNVGSIQADLNAGGIAGSMQLYDSMDPEGDKSTTVYTAIHTTYEVRGAITDSTNKGVIEAKKNYAAGICGYASFGLISGCKAFGDIASNSGDYIGGIAGYCDSKIKNCYAKCSLSGGDYIGGIIGSPIVEDSSLDSNAVVQNCISMVDIKDHGQFIGAISGYDEGNISGNTFCAENLAGINRYSEDSKTKPVTYEELIALKNIPSEFKKFTIKFVSDNMVVKAIDFNYGDSFDDSIYPDTPVKDGSFGTWEKTNLSNLKFDKTIKAVFKNDIITIESEQTRENDKSIFIAEGVFSNEDALSAIQIESDFSYQAKSFTEKLDLWKTEVESCWHIKVSGEQLDAIRYLPPSNENIEKLNIFLRTPDGYKRLDTRVIGSYIQFSPEDSDFYIVVASAVSALFAAKIAAGALIILVLLILIVRKVIIRRKTRKQN